MSAQYLLTITAEHVENPRTLGKNWRLVLECMGRLFRRDVGKRCYLVAPGVVQCENDEQLTKRKGKS